MKKDFLDSSGNVLIPAEPKKENLNSNISTENEVLPTKEKKRKSKFTRFLSIGGGIATIIMLGIMIYQIIPKKEVFIDLRPDLAEDNSSFILVNSGKDTAYNIKLEFELQSYIEFLEYFTDMSNNKYYIKKDCGDEFYNEANKFFEDFQSLNSDELVIPIIGGTVYDNALIHYTKNVEKEYTILPIAPLSYNFNSVLSENYQMFSFPTYIYELILNICGNPEYSFDFSEENDELFGMFFNQIVLDDATKNQSIPKIICFITYEDRYNRKHTKEYEVSIEFKYPFNRRDSAELTWTFINKDFIDN